MFPTAEQRESLFLVCLEVAVHGRGTFIPFMISYHRYLWFYPQGLADVFLIQQKTRMSEYSI